MTGAIREPAPVLPAGRRAGVCLHFTSLPGDYGIGELGAAACHFVDSLAAMKLEVWQYLPTGPTAWGNSPYQPLSSFAGNELLIDVDALRQVKLLTATEIAPLRTLPRDFVDYGALIPVKHDLLALAASRFDRKAPARLKLSRDDFVERNDREWLHDYALFRALKNENRARPWPDWDASFVHRDAKHLRRFETENERSIRSVKTLQYLFQHQWDELRRYAAAKGIRLFGDMPIYVALDGADAWSHRELFRLDRDGRPDRVAGVPPDYFSAEGQLWGNPLYDWRQHDATAYAWWISRLRHAASNADLVRVDHFRGFDSYWSVRAGATTARDGRWEPGPGGALFDAAQAALGQLPVVAENLGVITPEVEALRARSRLPGMRVLQFDIADGEYDSMTIDENSVCYTGTHDNDTAIGWFHGNAGDTRSPDDIARHRQRVLAVTGGTPETVHIDMLRLVLESNSRLAIAPLQDFLGLGSHARLNTPGTTENNWRWRVDRPLSDDFCEQISEMIAATGRAG